MFKSIASDARLIEYCWKAQEGLRQAMQDAARRDEALVEAKRLLHMPTATAKYFDVWGQVRGDELSEDLPRLERRIDRSRLAVLDKIRREGLPITEQGKLDYPMRDDGTVDFTSRVIEYYESAEQQERTRVVIKDGLLYRGPSTERAGELVDTGDGVTHFCGVGFEMFVVTADGGLFMAPQLLGQLQHSSLVSGADIAMSGEIKITQGRIENMNNHSGHYMPSADLLVQFLRWLEEDGVELNFWVQVVERKAQHTGRSLLDGYTARGQHTSGGGYARRKVRSLFNGVASLYGATRARNFLEIYDWRPHPRYGALDRSGQLIDPEFFTTQVQLNFGSVPTEIQHRESKDHAVVSTWLR